MDPHQPDVFNAVDRQARRRRRTSTSRSSATCSTRCAGGIRRFTTSADACRTTASTSAMRPTAPMRRRRRSSPRRAAGNAATAERARGVRVLHDGVLRPSRRREGLDEAAAPRRAAQREHARAAVARPRHRLRLDRRPAADRRARPVSRPPRAGRTRCRRWSSTT